MLPAAAQSETAAQQGILRVATWGGAYGDAQKSTVLEPAEKALKVEIKQIPAERGIPAVDTADVLEVSQADLIAGCAKGKLAKLGAIDLKPGAQGEAAADDFIAGGLSECGVASFAWSSLFLFDRAKFTKRIPTRLADIFDTKRFPGKRAIFKRAENLFEFLAVANGAAAGTVYVDLADREKLDDVMARLQGLLPHIIWVETPKQGLEALSSGQASIAMGYSGRAFRKTIAGRFAAIWDVHVFDYSSWAISANARDPKLGKSFIALATSPEYLAAQSRLWPYGPMRKSAAAAVGRHSMLDIALAGYMPTTPERLAGGVQFDAAFWAKNSAKLNDRITALLEGFRLGVRVPPPTRRPEPPSPTKPAEGATATGTN